MHTFILVGNKCILSIRIQTILSGCVMDDCKHRPCSLLVKAEICSQKIQTCAKGEAICLPSVVIYTKTAQSRLSGSYIMHKLQCILLNWWWPQSITNNFLTVCMKTRKKTIWTIKLVSNSQHVALTTQGPGTFTWLGHQECCVSLRGSFALTDSYIHIRVRKCSNMV